jgi:biotin synthase
VRERARRGEGRRRNALLHGRGLALAEEEGHRCGGRDGARVRALGLETCATLGMLTPAQARELKDAGLDYYNHNLDTSPEFYGEIITTRTFQDRLDTLDAVRDAGLKTCCGGIVGMGETVRDRARMLRRSRTCRIIRRACRSTSWCRCRARRSPAPRRRIRFDFIRTIAVARVVLPKSLCAPVGRPRADVR